MPVYDYKCREHGLFHALATMAESGQPKSCPQCAVLCPQVIVLAPHLPEMAQTDFRAHERNERSRHEPVLSGSPERAEQEARYQHRHGSGCGCGEKPIGKSQLFYTADGKKMFPSMRPWMISH